MPTNPRTLYQVLEETTSRHGDAPALRQPIRGGDLQTYTWNDYKTAVEEIAAGLRSFGIGRGDVVAVHSETRAEFYLADLGIMANGSISAALYSSYPPADLVRSIQACRASAVIVEDPKKLAQIRQAPVSRWILLTGEAEGAMTLECLREHGRKLIERDAGFLGRLKSEVRPGDPAILYLTSGTTGEPKMTLASHAAIVANIDMGPEALPLGPADETVAFLPSAHIAQRVVVELLTMRSGTPVTFAESLNKLPNAIKAVRPTMLLAPPRMWERIQSTIGADLRKRPPIVQKLFQAALRLGVAAADRRRQGRIVPPHTRLALKLADLLFFSKIRSRLGGRLRIPISGAAPLGKQLADFYEGIGMPIIEGYGLTEGGVVALNPLDRPKPGSVGKALPGVETRIAEDGELLVKSPSLFLMYYEDFATTAEVLKDGWLHTGDLAEIDDEDYIFITGRKKDLIVSSTGKKIFPLRVESLLKSEPLISQVFLIGDKMPYLSALLTINPGVARELSGMERWQHSSSAEISLAEPVQAGVRRLVASINQRLAPFEQIRKYRVLPREFTIEDGELTALMKLRRNRVMEKFGGEIAELYREKEVINF